MEYLFAIIILWLISALYIACIKRQFPLHNFGIEEVLPFRGVLAFLIIADHLSQRVNLPYFSEFQYWGKFIVALFFFMTGYGLTMSYMKKGHSYLHGFIKKRIWKVFLPYLVAILFYASFRYVIYPDFNLWKNLWKTLLTSTYDFTEVLLPTSWFVVVIILFYLAFYIVLSVLKSISWSIILLFCFSFSYVLLFYKFLSFPLWWIQSIFAINIGMVYAFYEERLHRIISNNVILVYLLLIGVFVLLYIALPQICEYYYIELPHRYYLATTAIIPLFIVFAMSMTGFFHNRFLNFLGRYSLEIYLVQGAIIYIFAIYHNEPILYITLTYLVSMCVAWIIHKICLKVYSL